MSDSALLLSGVFRALITRNVPLGVSDYLDAIRALQTQMDSAAITWRPSRESVRRLCQILWARNSNETRLIDAIFSSIEIVPSDAGDPLDRMLQRLQPVDTTLREAERQGPGTRGGSGTDGDAARQTPDVAIEIQSPRETAGVALPYPVLPSFGDETFIMRPQTVVSPRTLAVLWRRYRRMFRSGPRTELDLEATVAERCRRGLIDRPALRPPRVNRARLLILADVSPSMVAWRPFLDALSQSLVLSRLPAAEMFYFANVPRRSFFRSPSLAGAVPAGTVLDAHRGAGLLIVSDAGAARGHLNHQRIERTHAFIDDTNRRARAIVWVNPMPRDRWSGTTAGALARDTHATFLPLDVPSLIRAVDILRGAKSH